MVRCIETPAEVRVNDYCWDSYHCHRTKYPRPRPMAPARSFTRRAHADNPPPSVLDQVPDNNAAQELFIDPMLGTPLAIYIEKDVEDREILVDLINVRYGASSPGISIGVEIARAMLCVPFSIVCIASYCPYAHLFVVVRNMEARSPQATVALHIF